MNLRLIAPARPSGPAELHRFAERLYKEFLLRFERRGCTARRDDLTLARRLTHADATFIRFKCTSPKVNCDGRLRCDVQHARQLASGTRRVDNRLATESSGETSERCAPARAHLWAGAAR